MLWRRKMNVMYFAKTVSKTKDEFILLILGTLQLIRMDDLIYCAID